MRCRQRLTLGWGSQLTNCMRAFSPGAALPCPGARAFGVARLASVAGYCRSAVAAAAAVACLSARPRHDAGRPPPALSATRSFGFFMPEASTYALLPLCMAAVRDGRSPTDLSYIHTHTRVWDLGTNLTLLRPHPGLDCGQCSQRRAPGAGAHREGLRARRVPPIADAAAHGVQRSGAPSP